MHPETSQAASAQGSLTSDPDRFSDDTWDLLLVGQDVARRWRHGQLDVEHLIQVLFSDRRYSDWVLALPIDSTALLDRLEGFLAEQPMARGDELFIGDDLE
ncbi:MAG: Clp protease N-terminal domain-containing protein, partial [Cyanobacteriota bacterium]|nr:Clp protease N-terminal domain-containing protein [Cyanobacteriota bacterium]